MLRRTALPISSNIVLFPCRHCLMCGLLAIRRSESGGSAIVAKIGWKEEPAEKVSYRRAESTMDCLIFAVYILLQRVCSGVATSSLKVSCLFWSNSPGVQHIAQLCAALSCTALLGSSTHWHALLLTRSLFVPGT